MADQTLDPAARQQLQSTQEGLLNVIDRIRTQGVGQYVDLPQLVVCGDQSSGKSSVLEAISRLRFPTDTGVCTRFATELVLRRGPKPGLSVEIQPGPSPKSAEERKRLQEFKSTLSPLSEFSALVEAAKDWVGLSSDPSTGTFSDDRLRVEITSPDQPHLTLVDLPGLTHTGKNRADVDLVTKLVESYMSNPRCIILAIVSAKSEIELQIVLELVRKHDPEGKRTLGIITKPDLLHSGSPTENHFLQLAKNEISRFKLGWHILKNRDYDTRDISDADRDEVERDFFSQGVWLNLPRGHVGIASLRKRLSKVLLDHISAQLPELISNLEAEHAKCNSRLKKLGDSREDPSKQRRFLTSLSNDFQKLAVAATEGNYSDRFFDKTDWLEPDFRQLRATIHERNENFANMMHRRGHRRRIIPNDLPSKIFGYHGNDSLTTFFANGDPDSETITASNFVVEIAEESRRNRGWELPGFPNAQLVGRLFRDQSKPWEEIAMNHVGDIWTMVRGFLKTLLGHLTDDTTSEAVFANVINPWMDERLDSMRSMTEVLLKSHKRGHPITYDSTFMTLIGIRRVDREKHQLRAALSANMPASVLDEGRQFTWQEIETAVGSQEPVDPHACAAIISSMEAYYKIAIKRFVDNMAVLVVEDCLIDLLPGIFSPEVVSGMDDSALQYIAAESEDVIDDRNKLKTKLQVLQDGLRTCRHHVDSSDTKHIVQGIHERSTLEPDSTLRTPPNPIFGQPTSTGRNMSNRDGEGKERQLNTPSTAAARPTTPGPSKSRGTRANGTGTFTSTPPSPLFGAHTTTSQVVPNGHASARPATDSNGSLFGINSSAKNMQQPTAGQGRSPTPLASTSAGTVESVGQSTAFGDFTFGAPARPTSSASNSTPGFGAAVPTFGTSTGIFGAPAGKAPSEPGKSSTSKAFTSPFGPPNHTVSGSATGSSSLGTPRTGGLFGKRPEEVLEKGETPGDTSNRAEQLESVTSQDRYGSMSFEELRLSDYKAA